MMDESSWVKDGTEVAEPVTTETPAEPTSEDTSTIESLEAVESVSTDDEVVVSEEVAQTFIDAKLGDEDYQLPQNLLVPQTRNGVTKYVPIEDVISDGMKGDDYRIKTTELKQRSSEIDGREAEYQRHVARMDAKATSLDNREAELKAAMTDPTSAAAYQDHLEQYENNEMYRKHVDAALQSEELRADLAVFQERDNARAIESGVDQALKWIEEMSPEYEGVDPARVQTEYARQLSARTATLSPDSVRNIYQAEAEYVNQTVSPLRDELAAIKSTLADLQAAKDAEQHNATTQHAVKRARTTPVSTGSGAPGQRSETPPGKFGPNELAERNSLWARGG